MTDHEYVREWTADEAVEKGVRESGDSVTPKVSRRIDPASGADHLAGIAPAMGDTQPGLPEDPPRRPAGTAEGTA